MEAASTADRIMISAAVDFRVVLIREDCGEVYVHGYKDFSIMCARTTLAVVTEICCHTNSR